MRGGDARTRAWRELRAFDRPLGRTWQLLAGSFVAIGVLMVLRLTTDRARPLDWLLVALLFLTGLLAVRHQTVVRELEAGRRAEAEGFARILRGLSRSVSPDAIVGAIVDELGEVTGADHVVVVQRRPGARGFEATLVSSRPGVPNATTLLPSVGIDDPLPAQPAVEQIALPIAMPEPALAVGGVPVLAGATAGVWGEAPADGGVANGGFGWDLFGAPRVAVRDPVGTIEDPDVGDAAASAAPTRSGATGVANRIAERVGRTYGLSHLLAEPLVVEGRVVGALVLSRRVATAWSPSARRILVGAASESSAALERAYSHREAETAASTDALTGLPNRRYFDEFCGLLARRRRADDAVGVLMIDVDRFKLLNDRFGHAVGDRVLRAVASAIGATVRDADVPARYGGEEFAVLLRNPSRQVALDVAERVRNAVRTLDLHELGVPGVTVSVGAAVARTPDQPIADLVAEADAALYRAKRGGRNRVVGA